MVTHRTISVLTVLAALMNGRLAMAQEVAGQPAEVVRAKGMMALWGIIILGIAMLAFLRIYTYSVRRRWQRPVKPSRMSPLQWEARRWRESWRNRAKPKESSDSQG